MKKLRPKDKRATVVALYGDLGSGKTTFTQFLAKHLGIKDEITSPTFVIMKKFTIEGSGFSALCHIDAYRLDKAQELQKLGWSEILAEEKNLILLEWPERVAEIVPPDAEEIIFEFVDENTRRITITEGGFMI